MATHSLGGRALATPLVNERAPAGLWKLRLFCGWTILLAALVGLFALSWDIQWHTAVGRDRTLTAPHLFILGSATLMGLTALVAVLLETRWARQSRAVAQNGTRFASFFSSSLGIYLVGYGALDAAIGFPIDQYWHTLYGVDVTIWAPFHIMLLSGFCICCLGVAFVLAEGASLATQQGLHRVARTGSISVIVAFATLMGMLSILLPQALSTGYISHRSLTFTVYPFMLGIMGMLVLNAAKRALPGLPVATCIALIYAFFGLISFLLIPPLMTWLLSVEQQSLLPGAQTVAVLAVSWQYPLIIAAVLLDGITWLAQRRAWTARKTKWMTFGGAALGITLAAYFYPLFINSQLLRTALGHSLVYSVKPVNVASGAVGRLNPGAVPLNAGVVPILVVSLLLGVLGTALGLWLGANLGDIMGRKEQ